MIVLLAALALALETPLVSNGSDWAYWDSGVDPGAGWTTLGYDDSNWLVGPAPLGYGQGGILTQVDYGGDPLNRHITTWFRHEFVVADASAFTGLALQLRRDDGAVVYVNGVEVTRSNLPAGVITPSTLASAALNGLLEQEILLIPLDPSTVNDGTNLVAVEVHQAAPSSPDLGMDLGLSGWDDAGAVTRGPYLQKMTETSVVVRWRTEGPVPSRVFVGDSPGALNDEYAGLGTIALEHEVEITGLSPGTTKYYGVGSADLGVIAGDDYDHVFTTSPVAGTRQPVRIWALGDAGTANVNQLAVRDAYTVWAGGVYPDLVLMLGDNAYNSGTDEEYQEAMFDIYPDTLRRVPFWSTIGNHDGYSASSITQTGPYFDLFTFPTLGEAGGVASGTEAYYSFDHANVHIVVLDSNGSDRLPGAAQLVWLDQDLQQTTQDWVIAIWHHPAYSKGSHNSDFETQLVEMRENAVPILESYGIDLALFGHSHSYERSFLLDQHYGMSSELDKESILDEGDGDPNGDGFYRKPTAGMWGNEGAIYITAGSSGKVSGGSLDHPAMFLSTSTLGSVVVEIDGDQMDVIFVDDLGAEADRLAVHKGVATITRIEGSRVGEEGTEMSFSAEGQLPDGTPITTFDWDFGDGTPVELGTDNVVHTWPSQGEWNMQVTALDENSTPFTEIAIVEVINGPPEVDPLVPPASCDEGELILWSGSATDPGGDPITYLWDFGDGTELVGQEVEYRLGDDGPHTITLYATDDSGATGEASMLVACNNMPPAFLGLSHPPLVDQAELTLTALYTDPGRDDVVTVDWDLEGAFPWQGPELVHTFPSTGEYGLRVTLTDDDGGEQVVNLVLSVTNGPPILDVLAIPGGIGEGEDVAMTVIAHEPSGEPFTVAWDFGDGTGAIGSDVRHTWNDDGVYSIGVVLDDGSEGGRVSLWNDVIIENRSPSIDMVSVGGGATEGAPVALSAAVSDPGLSDVLTVVWDFGGVFPTVGATATWTPQDDGAYEGWVRVSDEEGLGESVPVAVTVSNGAPSIAGLPGDTEAFVEERWEWAAEAINPGRDSMTWSLAGPRGSFVGPDGVVHWTPHVDFEGKSEWFILQAMDDGGLTAEVSWTVAVNPKRAGAHANFRDSTGCSHVPAVPQWALIWAGLLVVTRRR